VPRTGILIIFLKLTVQAIIINKIIIMFILIFVLLIVLDSATVAVAVIIFRWPGGFIYFLNLLFDIIAAQIYRCLSILVLLVNVNISANQKH
jgi:hypothetical protein